jgi:hypothetical protein
MAPSEAAFIALAAWLLVGGTISNFMLAKALRGHGWKANRVFLWFLVRPHPPLPAGTTPELRKARRAGFVVVGGAVVLSILLFVVSSMKWSG